MTFAQLKVDEAFEPEGFREEMERYIYRRIRETKTTKAPLAQILKECQERFEIDGGNHHEASKGDEGEEGQVQQFLNFPKAKGKGKGKGNKGPNKGKGLCFNCGEAGHYVANCPKPKKDGTPKGIHKGKGKQGKGLNALADVFKAVGLQTPNEHNDGKKAPTLNMIRPTCCITRANRWQSDEKIGKINVSHEYHAQFLEATTWIKPKKTVKPTTPHVVMKDKIKTMFLSVFLKMGESLESE